jgi:hypothetical protein
MVRTYSPEDPYVGMVENGGGGFVRLEDYEGLEAANERLRNVLARLYGACAAADADEELDERINGSLRDECLRALEDLCPHEWVDPSNEVVQSNGWVVCTVCGLLRKGAP